MKFRYEELEMPLTRNVDGILEWDGDCVRTYEYEPTDEEIRRALVNIILEIYFETKNITEITEVRKGIKAFVLDLDLDDKTIARLYYDDLKEYFREDAIGDCHA